MPHTATHRVADRRSVQEGDLLWTPSPERVQHTRLTATPLTRSGRKMEVPVRRLLLGADPAAVAGPSAMADPAALADFVEYARTQRDYSLA